MVYVYYGKERIEFDLPSNWNLLSHCKVMEPTGTGDMELERALSNPIATPKLSEIASKGGRAVILSDDNQRPTPAFKIIPRVLDQLNEGGIKDKDITLVVASGSHLKPSLDVLERKYGKEVLDRVELRHHSEYVDADDELICVGETKRKNAVYVSREVMSADVKVGIGLIVPAFMSGFGGGAKIVLPGVCGRETIIRNHLLFDHPRVGVGIMDGNPAKEEMEEAAQMIGLDFIVNVVVNSKREVVRAVAGHVVAAHREGVKEWRKLYEVRVPRAADVVITSSTPFDTHLQQALKPTRYASNVCKDGGVIVHATPAYEGIRSSTYDLLARVRPDFRKMVQMLRDGEREHEMVRKLIYPEMSILFCSTIMPIMEKKKIMLVSDGIARKEAEEMGFGYANTIQEAVQSVQKTMPRADVIVLQNAIPLPVLGS